MKNNLKYIGFTFLISVFVFCNSCKTREKLAYFQSFETIDTLNQTKFEFRFKEDDIVTIKVSCFDIEAAKPFNTDFGLNANVNAYSSGSAVNDGYLIDSNGEINFPVIGKIKISGLNRLEANDLIIFKLKEYLKDPIVNIRLANFRITVLGSVLHPGTFSIPNEKISIYEAIGLSNDLKITGQRKTVTVIREDKGKKVEHKIDLTSKNVFNSKVYYLEQNDIVYVEPNMTERYDSKLFKQSGAVLVSAISAIITILIVLTRI